MTIPRPLPNDKKWAAQDALTEARDQLKRLEDLAALKSELPTDALTMMFEIVGGQYRTVRFLERLLGE